MYTCLKCAKECRNEDYKYFVMHKDKIVPFKYYLCEEHKDLNYTYEDIYNSDINRSRKIIYAKDKDETKNYME